MCLFLSAESYRQGSTTGVFAVAKTLHDRIIEQVEKLEKAQRIKAAVAASSAQIARAGEVAKTARELKGQPPVNR
jgi:hypothetical protein